MTSEHDSPAESPRERDQLSPPTDGVPRAISIPRTMTPAEIAHDLMPIGAVLANRFEIERVIGVGGMGVVYLARDRTLERLVAIKLHQADAGGARLQREAVAMARLAHPNVITIFEVGAIGSRVFVAMEYIAGKTLRAWATAKPRTIRERLKVLAEAGAGLAAAHAAGLVHRDFKPDNILIGDDGRARVGDFGLARGSADSGAFARLDEDDDDARDGAGGLDVPSMRRTPSPSATPIAATGRSAPSIPNAPVDVEAATLGMSNAPAGPPVEPSWRTPLPASGSGHFATPLTQTGAVLGTPAYMSPEQAKGGAIDARADQFAFSVVAWELLFGARPFAGTTLLELVTAVLHGKRTPPPRGTRVPVAVRQVLERGTAPEPADRFADMTALLVALRRAEHTRTRRIAIAAGATIVVGGVAAALIAMHASTPAVDCERNAHALAALVPTTLPAQLRTIGAAEAGDRVDAELVHFTDSLRTTSLQVCGSAAEHNLTPALVQRADACLQIAARTAARLVSVEAVNADDAPNLVLQTQSLGDVTSCMDAAALLAAPPLPADPTRLGQFEATRAAIGAIGPRLAGGNVSSARALLTEAEASPVANEPAIATRLVLARAGVAGASDHQADAERGYEDAYYASRAIDDVDVELSAVSNLIAIADEVDQDPHKIEQWTRAGVSDAERARTRSPHRAAAVFIAAAGATARGAHAEQAAAWCATGLELAGPTPTLTRLEGLGVAGEIACVRGRNDECFADHAEAIAEARALLGPHHLRVGYLLQNAALDYNDAGHGADALVRAREAETLFLAAPESSGLDRLNALDTLAALLLTAGTPADRKHAREVLESVHVKMVAALGAENPQLAVVESNLALAYMDSDDAERARALLVHALALDEASVGPTDTSTADILFNLADVQRTLTLYADAIASAKRTVAIRVATSPGSALHGAALALLAQIENESGDAVAALADARAALALPALKEPIETRARAEVALARALATEHGNRAEAIGAIAEARAIFVTLQHDDWIARCDAVSAEL